MKIKTSELIGQALDWAVAKCEGYQPVYTDGSIRPVFRKWLAVESTWPPYSTDHSHGGPIMDGSEIGTWPPDEEHPHWTAGTKGVAQAFTGPTRLIAAMRCYVASKLGEEIEVPMKLFKRYY